MRHVPGGRGRPGAQARVGCVLVAAGAGTRLAAGRPKAYVEVGGRPLVVHAAAGLAAAGVLDRLVVVVPAGLEAETRALLEPVEGLPPTQVVVGGASRQASVAAGLLALHEGTPVTGDVAPVGTDAAGPVDVVLVHDAARALTPPGLVMRVVEAVRDQGHAAVVPAVPVHDTLRHVDGGVVDRSLLRAVQTPQGFAAAALERAHGAPAVGDGATDDAGLVEALGDVVHVVVGDPEAFKITSPLDLRLAEAVLAVRAAVPSSAARPSSAPRPEGA